MPEIESRVAGGYRRFLKSWLDDPFSVGAVAPSGRSLARMMTRGLAPGDRVLELGPGTGTVTRAILGRGVAERDLILLERCPGFAEMLASGFPQATVLRGDATVPQAGLAGHAGAIDYVVSGLPLVLFSREQKHRLLGEVFRLLSADGALLQFTYGGRCPIDRRQLERHGLQARCTGFIALNVPPAFVYRISRAGSS